MCISETETRERANAKSSATHSKMQHIGWRTQSWGERKRETERESEEQKMRREKSADGQLQMGRLRRRRGPGGGGRERDRVVNGNPLFSNQIICKARGVSRNAHASLRQTTAATTTSTTTTTRTTDRRSERCAQGNAAVYIHIQTDKMRVQCVSVTQFLDMTTRNFWQLQLSV